MTMEIDQNNVRHVVNDEATSKVSSAKQGPKNSFSTTSGPNNPGMGFNTENQSNNDTQIVWNTGMGDLKKVTGDATNESSKNARKQPENSTTVTAITAPDSTSHGMGFIEDVIFMCQELLDRANGTTMEGHEPWRKQGLTWKSNDCGNQGLSVLGNHLSRWYAMRTLAAAAGVTVSAYCDSPVTNQIPNVVRPSDTVIDGDGNFSWKSTCQACVNQGREGICKYPHGEPEGFLDRAINTIRTDLRTMANNVVAKSPKLVLDEVTIHLRCGDIGRQNHGLYGLVPYESYASLIPKTAKSIGIVTAPFKQARADWGHGDSALNKAVVYATKDYLQVAFPDATVSIRNRKSETMDVVYSRLILSNHTICGPSTFCLFPSLASIGESYIFQSPLFSGESSWLNRVAHSFEGVHYVDQFYIPSSELYNLNVSDILDMLGGNPSKPIDAVVVSNTDANRWPSDNLKNGKRVIPSWSKLGRTQFTNHVLDLIADLNLDGDTVTCDSHHTFTVQMPNSIPNITCGDENMDCRLLKRIFRSKPLPYNISVGFHRGDGLDARLLKERICFGNSSPRGKLCIPNMEDIIEMDHRSDARDKGPEQYRRQYNGDIPWKERSPKPVFRGSAWLPKPHEEQLCRDPEATYSQMMEVFPGRYRAVDFSVDHPDLLDARFSRLDHLTVPCMERNVTNGLSKLLPVDPIEQEHYYSKYQVALVLQGIAAAFRMSNHLMTRTAVLLQECEVQEWYKSYLKPYVHYIPVSENLGDLKDALEWVKSNPAKVKAIAINGRKFYEEYLTFHRHEEHIYELVYRLSEYAHFKNKTARKRADG